MMGFEQFGKVSFASQTKVDAFVELLQKEGLHATQCRVCGKAYFPPRADCASCLSSDMEWFRVEGKGKLVSYTRAYFGPTGFEEDVPYVLAVADFNKVKVFGRLKVDLPEDGLKTGMSVQVKTLTLTGGKISYEFELA